MDISSRVRYLLRRCLNLEIPLGALAALVELRSVLESLEIQLVEAARAKGATWEEIAETLGVTRQAMHQRVARHTRREARTGGTAESQSGPAAGLD